jgi:outer membrane protein OmpU
MNNIKKIGATALAGSLAMVSANAVEYTMSGGMSASYSTANSTAKTIVATDSGRGLGAATDLGFNASGELDNGFTVGYFMSLDTHGTVANTSSQMTVGMGSLGTLQLNNIAGAKANGIDDITPNAYNETWDGLTGTSTLNNPSFFGSHTGSGSIDYRIPAQEVEGVTINASITYDPNISSGPAKKGGVTASSNPSGTAVTLQLAHESGLEIGGGYEETETASNHATAAGATTATGYVKFATGGLTAAYQEAALDGAQTGVNAAGTGLDKESQMLGVAYTMGDITVSYAESEIDVAGNGTTAALATIELTSIQAAYTMGAMTVSAAMSSTDNNDGILGSEYTENTLAVSFAF